MAGGNRVQKFQGTSWNYGTSPTVIYVLTLDNKKLGDMDPSDENLLYANIYAPGGRLLATYGNQSGSSPGYTYNLTDWLGTKRMQVSASGDAQEYCISNPFGDGLSCSGSATDSTEQHFTGKDRDVESSLDNFYARYYSSDLGRFMTPDWSGASAAVPYASFGDPQSLNLYAYVGNNPNTGIDADGHCGDPGGYECLQEGQASNPGQGNMADWEGGSIDASFNTWNQLGNLQFTIPGGFLTWMDMTPTGQGYVAGKLDAAAAMLGLHELDILERSIRYGHGLLGFAGHTFISDPGNHQWEVEGLKPGGGRDADQEVQDTYHQGNRSEGELLAREWLATGQYNEFTKNREVLPDQ